MTSKQLTKIDKAKLKVKQIATVVRVAKCKQKERNKSLYALLAKCDHKHEDGTSAMVPALYMECCTICSIIN